MKKIIFTCLAYFSISFTQAQGVHFGLKAGLNASNLVYKNQGETELKLGVHGGGLAHIHLTKKFALQPELVISTQGGKRIINNTDYNTNLNYLNVPVLLQYMFNNGFRIQAGPQVGFLLTARDEVNDNENNVIQNFKTTDVSVPVGVSFLHHSGLGIDARWVFGLTNINDVGNRQPETRNSVGQLGLFYLLHYGSHGHR